MIDCAMCFREFKLNNNQYKSGWCQLTIKDIHSAISYVQIGWYYRTM